MPHNILLLEGFRTTGLMGFHTFLGQISEQIGLVGGHSPFSSLVWRSVDWGSISTLQKDCFSGYPGWRQLSCDYQQSNSTPKILKYKGHF